MYLLSDASGGVQGKGAKSSQMCQRALTQKQSLGCGSALERGHGALLEPLAQRSDPLSGGNELALIVIVPTNAVPLETERAKGGAGF